jgi:hypothetical protein
MTDDRRQHSLVDFFLLVDAELSRAHVDEQEETAAASISIDLRWKSRVNIHNRQNLEKVVLGKVLVGVVGFELRELLAIVVY